MTLRAYLLVIALAAALSLAAAGFIVATTDPGTAPMAIYLLLGASAFLGLTGVFAILGLAVRIFIVKRNDVIARQTAIAFRQALALSAAVVIAISLHGDNLLTWWNAALLILGVTLLESLFIAEK